VDGSLGRASEENVRSPEEIAIRNINHHSHDTESDWQKKERKMDMLKFRPLTADDVEVRISTVKKNGVQLLLYKDARVDQNVLDESVGVENWQKKYEMIGGNLFCSVGILVDRGAGIKEWIWKQDVGVESYTEKEKGQASDAFKRACFCLGIGRELYTAPFIWISADKVEIKDAGKDTYKCYERFAVRSMTVSDGRITALSVINSKGIEVFSYGKRTAQSATQEPTQVYEQKPMLVTEAEIKILEAELARTGVAKQTICNAYHVNDLSEFTLGQYNSCKKRLAATKPKEE
jgi:hypothetical protein